MGGELGNETNNPFRTAVPFRGQPTQISSSLSPKRDCGARWVNINNVGFLILVGSSVNLYHFSP